LSLFCSQKSNQATKRLNYSIQCLSTAIWKYAGFSEFDWNKVTSSIENQIISLSQINQNHLIIIDRDNDYEDKPPSKFSEFSNKIGQYKARLIHESMNFLLHEENNLANNFGDTKDGNLSFWVNDGTIETYLEYFTQNSGGLFNDYFEKKKGMFFTKKSVGNRSTISKVELAAEIASYSLEHNLTFFDFAADNSPLQQKIGHLRNTIKGWN
jgi:hypothetical protein